MLNFSLAKTWGNLLEERSAAAGVRFQVFEKYGGTGPLTIAWLLRTRTDAKQRDEEGPGPLTGRKCERPSLCGSLQSGSDPLQWRTDAAEWQAEDKWLELQDS